VGDIFLKPGNEFVSGIVLLCVPVLAIEVWIPPGPVSEPKQS
jgi:hypothetical protein